MTDSLVLASSATFLKGWDLSGDFTTIDLIAATTNALNGALLARRPDRPLWETGEERVLASAQCIVLAARSDLDGEVEIEVRVGAALEDQAAAGLLFDGELLTTGQGILVGNSLTELHHVGLPIGWHPIRVYAEPPNNPAWFTVLLEVRSAGG